MFDDMGRDMLMLSGALVGFLGAFLSVLEKLLDLRTKLKPEKERKTPAPAERAVASTASQIDFFSTKPLRGTSYLLLYESGVILAAGLILNYVGLTLSRHMESILFLDMTGTALVAFLFSLGTVLQVATLVWLLGCAGWAVQVLWRL